MIRRHSDSTRAEVRRVGDGTIVASDARRRLALRAKAGRLPRAALARAERVGAPAQQKLEGSQPIVS